MVDGRYRDKKYLAKYDLSIDLFDRFNLKVNDVFPIRNVYVLSTNKGEKVLKRIDYSLEDLEYINSAVKYIKNNFKRILDFVEAQDGRVYTEWKNDIYSIMDLVPGRECDFSNPVDLRLASIGLGEFHKASEGFTANISKKQAVGKTIEDFKRRAKEIELFKSIANMHEYKSEFDKLFLDKVDLHLQEVEKSIDILERSSIQELWREADKIAFCHNDLAYHNILINNEEAYFIDFDYSVVDLKVRDLCNFINKAIKNAAFDMEKAEAILTNYSETNSLDERELMVLYGLLYFPEDFYSISKDYYTKRKDWEEETFYDKLVKKVSYNEERNEFLKEFKEKIS